MTNFSKDQLDKIRALLEKVGVKPDCPACKQGMLVPTGAHGGTAGSTGRIATCVLFSCNSCGFVRMHSLMALGLDNMM